jgi:REP element-mobilizing transposase RayT
MARGPRLDAPGSLHHVIVRGIERRRIFETEKDRQDFLDRLETVVTEGKTTCFAWALIPNHAHILLRTGTAPLAKMMRRLLTGYAVSFNLRYQRAGHLFQNRYKSIICEEDSYLLELVRYIHLNCIRAGLVRGMEELDRYRWSGHSALMGSQDRPWQAREEVLSYFGKKEGIAKRKYRQFVFEGVSLGRREELTTGGRKGDTEGGSQGLEGKQDVRILGSSGFVDKILAEEARRNQKRALFKKKRISIEELINSVGKAFGTTGGEVIGGSQRQTVTLARSVVCYLGSRDLGMTGRELSRELNLTPAAIHYAVLRGEKYLVENKEVEEKLSKYLTFLTTSP